MKSIAVLLSVHNRCEHTHRCLSQLYKASIPSNYILHIYITDDGCTDGTPEMINKLYSNINLIKGMVIYFGIEECIPHGMKQQRRIMIFTCG